MTYGDIPDGRLTPRQLEVLRWARYGLTASETAEILGISTRTVTFHITHILRHLGCTSKHQAVLRAVELGLISVGRGRQGLQEPRGDV